MASSNCLVTGEKVGYHDKPCPEHRTLPLDDPSIDVSVRVVCLQNIVCGTCVHYEDHRIAIRKDAKRGVAWAIKLIKELEP